MNEHQDHCPHFLKVRHSLKIHTPDLRGGQVQHRSKMIFGLSLILGMNSKFYHFMKSPKSVLIQQVIDCVPVQEESLICGSFRCCACFIYNKTTTIVQTLLVQAITFKAFFYLRKIKFCINTTKSTDTTSIQ